MPHQRSLVILKDASVASVFYAYATSDIEDSKLTKIFNKIMVQVSMGRFYGEIVDDF
jgi:hypothetical protein